ncbi:hypothetical protein P5673_005341 [Acropora cervicornis]|uniref:Uncharacterized protein n=1 Tax=Acropora cervicornis TaxID=6130 RepID=A0AAD9VCI8_ACRCE|nr:hypothetical protein P5673_005341 [Acropora cervicornis]
MIDRMAKGVLLLSHKEQLYWKIVMNCTTKKRANDSKGYLNDLKSCWCFLFVLVTFSVIKFCLTCSETFICERS